MYSYVVTAPNVDFVKQWPLAFASAASVRALCLALWTNANLVPEESRCGCPTPSSSFTCSVSTSTSLAGKRVSGRAFRMGRADTPVRSSMSLSRQPRGSLAPVTARAALRQAFSFADLCYPKRSSYSAALEPLCFWLACMMIN